MFRGTAIRNKGTLKNNVTGRTSYRICSTAETVAPWFSPREIGYDS